MVGGSQGVHKVLIYSGFNILLFFFAYAKGFLQYCPLLRNWCWDYLSNQSYRHCLAHIGCRYAFFFCLGCLNL